MLLYSVIVIFLAAFLITMNWFLAFVVAFVAFNILGGWKYTKTLFRDFMGIQNYVKMKRLVRKYEKKNKTVVECFEETVAKYPNNIMFNFEGKHETFQLVNDRAEKLAAFFQSLGVQKGDCVAFFMDNSPDLVTYWLGCAKIGAISSLINFNLREKSLSHSIDTCSPKFVVVSDSLQSHLVDILDDLALKNKEIAIFSHTEGFPSSNEPVILEISPFEKILTKLNSVNEGYVRPKLEFKDLLMYIYTSGTTGLPKAARITNYRFMNMAVSVGFLNSYTSSDVIWTPLPLYHSNAGICAVGQAIYNGTGLAFRRKFSASRFWDDIVESGATSFNYLGEILRYIYKQPFNQNEKRHKLRTIFGNGLKTGLWVDIKARYEIPHICEIYGSTEGNCNLVNLDETPGACGFLSIIFPSDAVGIYLLKCDDEGNLIRNEKGLCIRTGPGEQGLIVGAIRKTDPTKQYDGYVGEKETKKKVARDVKRKGDEAFMSGDILYMDELGYLFFKDRTGDTFRWKGENVSTCEVESALISSVDHKDVIVFGVEIPGTDGKAGMAAIVNEDGSVDMERVSKAVLALPSYARPIFVRLMRSNVEKHMTGTFKLRKVDLQKEGFDVENVEDPIWFWVAKSSKYELMSHELYTNIIQGKVNL